MFFKSKNHDKTESKIKITHLTDSYPTPFSFSTRKSASWCVMCQAAHQVLSVRMRCGSAGALSSNLSEMLTHQCLVLPGQGIDSTLQLTVSLPPLVLSSLQLLFQKLDLLSEILHTYKKITQHRINPTIQMAYEGTCLIVKIISGHDSGSWNNIPINQSVPELPP